VLQFIFFSLFFTDTHKQTLVYSLSSCIQGFYTDYSVYSSAWTVEYCTPVSRIRVFWVALIWTRVNPGSRSDFSENNVENFGVFRISTHFSSILIAALVLILLKSGTSINSFALLGTHYWAYLLKKFERVGKKILSFLYRRIRTRLKVIRIQSTVEHMYCLCAFINTFLQLPIHTE